MSDGLTKADAEAVERTRQLFLFNQLSVVAAMAAGAAFYVVWIDSSLLLLGLAYLIGKLAAIEWAKRHLRVDTLNSVGVAVLILNWTTAIVLTLLVPFSFPLGILQVLSPMLAAGPVLERKGLVRVLIGGPSSARRSPLSGSTSATPRSRTRFRKLLPRP